MNRVDDPLQPDETPEIPEDGGPPARRHASEDEARDLMESSRDTDWAGRGFLKELFLGRFHYDWVHPFPEPSVSEEFTTWLSKVRRYFEEEVDSARIDETGEYPPEMIEGLKELGLFGIKIPKKYGGLGFSQYEYGLAMEVMGRYDANVLALLSAHQSIGVPQPVKLFGTEEQKERFLPRCAKGAITAFALTEPDVGSDPARLATTATKTPEGDYLINGTKLWCTNGTFADMIVVMARDPESRKISAFVVELPAEGFSVENRCHFMGLRALANGVLVFKDVRVPADNLIGKVGGGLKVALTTLNAGRLSIPSGVAGGSQLALQWVREFARDRVQWGVPVGKHEAVSHMLTEVLTLGWGIQSMARLSNAFADRPGYDIRLEAAAAKEWCTTRHWDLTDTAIQIKGGRGYETETSLAARGEKPTSLERTMRDARINRIFEGSSEIMHLFMAREALDKHLTVAGNMVLPNKTFGERMQAVPGMLGFYTWWYPSLWLGLTFLKYRDRPLGGHLRFIERNGRKLARNVFHGMVVYQAKLERKQAFLFRGVDVANELYAMSAVVSRAETLAARNAPEAEQALEIADVFCRGARRRIRAWFHAMWANDDDAETKVGKAILEGRYKFAEQPVVD